jgi:hypothetical protein
MYETTLQNMSKAQLKQLKIKRMLRQLLEVPKIEAKGRLPFGNCKTTKLGENWAIS